MTEVDNPTDNIQKFTYLTFFYITDSPLNSPSGKRKSVRVSRYFEDGPAEDTVYNRNTNMPAQTNGTVYSTTIPGMYSHESCLLMF